MGAPSRQTGTQLQWTYDAAGRQSTLTFPGGFLDANYYPNNPPAGGAAGRLSALLGPYTTNLAYQYDGSLMTLTYDTLALPRDALGRIATKTETFGATTVRFDYSYDALGRLQDVLRNNVQHEHFGYDGNGNRTTRQVSGTQTNFYDNQDRLTTYENFTFTYTANGELLGKLQTGTYNSWTYSYDALGNLLSVTLPGGQQVTYAVDGLNRRVERTKAGVAKRWLYRDALTPVAELDGTGAVVSRFIYASRSNIPDYIIRGGQTYRLIGDQLGSPRLAVNVTSGQIAYQANYSSFGVQTMVVGTADWIPFGFAGGLYDVDTGLVRFGARDYDPVTGRWVSKDPIRFESGDFNLYEYVRGDPINRMDSRGTDWSSPECKRCNQEAAKEHDRCMEGCKRIGTEGQTCEERCGEKLGKALKRCAEEICY